MNNSQLANDWIPVTFGVGGAVGLIGNIFLLTLVSKNFRNCQPYEKVIFATLVTDLCISFNIACLEPYAILDPNTTFFCKIVGFFFVLFANMNSIWTTINMFSRYLALYHKERYEQWFNTRGILICYAFAVVVNIPIVMPMIYYDMFGFISRMGMCAVSPTNSIMAMYSFSCYALPYISAFISFVFGYFVIKKIRNHISQVSSILDSNLVDESRQIVILVAVSTLIPFVIQSFGVVIKVLRYFTNVNPWFSRVSMSFVSLIPASAPFITAFTIKPYREKVVKIFSRIFKTTMTTVVKINLVNH